MNFTWLIYIKIYLLTTYSYKFFADIFLYSEKTFALNKNSNKLIRSSTAGKATKEASTAGENDIIIIHNIEEK